MTKTDTLEIAEKCGLISPDIATAARRRDTPYGRLADKLEAFRAEIERRAVPDEGKLWSWIRKVMQQGTDILHDTENHGCEVYSARLDAAASARTDELIAMLAAAAPSPKEES